MCLERVWEHCNQPFKLEAGTLPDSRRPGHAGSHQAKSGQAKPQQTNNYMSAQDQPVHVWESGTLSTADETNYKKELKILDQCSVQGNNNPEYHHYGSGAIL